MKKKVFKDLIDFLEDHDITDQSADDGDGRTDTWRSVEFENLIKNAKRELKK